MSNLELRLMKRPDASVFIRVRLRSQVSHKVVAQVDVEDKGSEERTKQAILVAGGALAEYLGNQHLDQFDTDTVAWEAKELYSDLLRDIRARS